MGQLRCLQATSTKVGPRGHSVVAVTKGREVCSSQQLAQSLPPDALPSQGSVLTLATSRISPSESQQWPLLAFILR